MRVQVEQHLKLYETMMDISLENEELDTLLVLETLYRDLINHYRKFFKKENYKEQQLCNYNYNYKIEKLKYSI